MEDQYKLPAASPYTASGRIDPSRPCQCCQEGLLGTRREECKLFRALRTAGWQTQRLDVGLEKLELINAQQLFQIAMQVVGDDPTLLLSDDPHCLFCAEYQRTVRNEWQPPDKPTAIKAAPEQL